MTSYSLCYYFEVLLFIHARNWDPVTFHLAVLCVQTYKHAGKLCHINTNDGYKHFSYFLFTIKVLTGQTNNDIYVPFLITGLGAEMTPQS